ncbi:D-2-hydroxyacid dehydrogenase [Microbacterium oryzae]|uniref:D-2-hydroxyacid dehydrogenase n=1 Tax=Microbacterium oryzae TaxID=743009 RepID=UPI0025AFC6FC|nr:D-2-hydroxyacid dehydrogenase [Microbacterium oryzae]MDN3312097.1 D-2-hydroxyacid dehydrogenase [Microbacterium oryzae]
MTDASSTAPAQAAVVSDSLPALRVAVAAPLAEADAQRIVELEPRVELLHVPGLLPPMRFPADFSGDPAFSRSAAQQRAFEELLEGADALYGIPDVNPQLLASTIRSNPQLRWVQTMAAGGGGQVRAAGLTSAELERVVFTTSAGVHGDSLAEFALFGVLAGAKSLPRLSAQRAARQWTDRWTMGQLSTMNIVVLGNGGIGRKTAEKLHLLGAQVVSFSRSGAASEGQVTPVAPLPEVWDHLADADALISTLPGTAATERLIDRDFLAALKPGATFVNVGRGTVVDEEALVDALRAGTVGFAALDVFAVEPLPESSPLWELPQVIVSPHTAALDPREERRIAELFADNATRFLDGRSLRNVVDTVDFY